MKLSIIIIEYNCMSDVLACLVSVRHHLAEVDHECIVISNSRYDEARISGYRADLGDAKLVRAAENLGYAGGVNLGLRESVGDYVYILNPDCLLTDSNIIGVIQDMEANPEWAIAGPKVIDDYGEVQPSCRRFPKPWTFLLVRSILSNFVLAKRERGRYLMKDFRHNFQGAVDWVSGGAMVVKVSALKTIGGMDQRYFLYMEDVDWCHTSWQKGFMVIYSPKSTVIHSGQHKSINAGLLGVASRHVRMHMGSMFKYFMKFGMRLPENGVDVRL